MRLLPSKHDVVDSNVKNHNDAKQQQKNKKTNPEASNQIIVEIEGYTLTKTEFGGGTEESFWKDRLVAKQFDNDGDEILKSIDTRLSSFPFEIKIPKNVPQSRQVIKQVVTRNMPIRDHHGRHICTITQRVTVKEVFVKYRVTAYYQNKKTKSVNINVTNHNNLSTMIL